MNKVKSTPRQESAALRLVGFAVLAQQIRRLDDLAASQITSEAEDCIHDIRARMSSAFVDAFPDFGAVGDDLLNNE